MTDAEVSTNEVPAFEVGAPASLSERGDSTVLRVDTTKGVMIAASPVMRRLIDDLLQVAESKASVLIEGESGTGKEYLARLVHEHSLRRNCPYVCVNCAALPENLVESELFGHERGAFTGADAPRAGRFELAKDGTLLLDEIGELPLSLQAKLLRVLEEKEVQRLGSERTVRADVRVVATTNRSLEQECREGRFRWDLFYRLNVGYFRVPPLRERREEIIPLAELFLAQFRDEASRPVTGLQAATTKLLLAYHWPGNVRQLRNVIHRARIRAKGPCLCPADLPAFDAAPPATLPFESTTIEEMERRLIMETLRELGGNKTAAALRLGVTARTLLNKLKRYSGKNVA